MKATSQTIDLISEEKCNAYNTVIRLKKVNNMWEPIFIMHQNDNPTIPIVLNGSKIILNNNNSSSDSSIQYVKYQKVLFPPQPYEFYTFTISEKLPNNKIKTSTYFTPANIDDSIIINKKTIKKGEVYSRKDFFDIVKSDFFNKNVKNNIKE